MSDPQKTQNKTSPKQVELALTKFKDLFSSTGSVVIDLMSDYKFLVACAKDGDQRAIAHQLLDKILDERKVKSDKWKAEHPQQTAVEATA